MVATRMKAERFQQCHGQSQIRVISCRRNRACLTQIKVQTEYDRSMTGTTGFDGEKRLEKVCGVVSQPHPPIHSCCCEKRSSELLIDHRECQDEDEKLINPNRSACDSATGATLRLSELSLIGGNEGQLSSLGRGLNSSPSHANALRAYKFRRHGAEGAARAVRNDCQDAAPQCIQ